MDETIYDVAIAGAGPAGITAGIYALRASLKTLIFDGGLPGGTLGKLERIENYPGFASASGKQIAEAMTKQLDRLGGRIIPHYVTDIIHGSPNMLVVGSEIYYCRFVILATGLKRNKPGFIANFKGRGVSYCAVCDGNFYRGKDVAVIGDGLNAQEDAAYLSKLCGKVYLITSNHDLKSPDGVEKIVAVPSEIIGTEQVEGISYRQNGETGSKKVDGVFVAMGSFGAGETVKGLKTENGFVVTDAKGKTNLDTVYAAGDAVNGSLKQVVSACAAGAIAADEICKLLKK